MVLSSDEIRQKYIEYFQKNGHVNIEASGLLPQGDSSLLFVNSGMFPLVPYLLGADHPQGNRLVNSQRCFRTDDIDEVGDQRHTTCFEMLGNWSLGDYFKKEQIHFWYTFLFDELKIDPTKIYQTVFGGSDTVPADEESIKYIQEEFAARGVTAELGPKTTGEGEVGPGVECDFSKQRIFQYGADKNRWQRGNVVGETGGTDTETFYDTGKEHNKSFGEHCHPNCDCGRFIEIGNSVFMQYKLTESGREKIERQNVDFGGGLERITMAVQWTDNVFKTDVFQPYIQLLADKYNISYEDNAKDVEVIVDHIRAVALLIMDGALPSNKDQGYYLRRLIRRVVTKLQLLNVDKQAVHDLLDSVIEKLGVGYPELREKNDEIKAVVEKEVKSFSQNLKKGLQYFEKMVGDKNEVDAESAFMLQTSYGFPIELIEEIGNDRGIKVDVEGYKVKVEEHKNISRQGMEKKFKSGLGDSSDQTIKYHTATHLLHQTLREVLGGHVQQKGSNITAERLRFDFSHPAAMTPEQIKEVEDKVNAIVQKGFTVSSQTMETEKAFAEGAIGFFGDKYGPEVSVYTISAPDGSVVSKEICTGPHVESSDNFGTFKITSEWSVSAGVRRIKAILE